MKGQIIGGKYRVLQKLGEGGMGAVYEALDDRTGDRVAVKVLVSRAHLANEEMLARFEREARAVRAIDTEHVVKVVDSGVDAALGLPFLVMELMSGADLQQLIRRLAPIPPDLVLRIAAQACVGLEKAHEAGVIHRDIKSANLYLARRDGGEVVVKLLDFGIAKVKAERPRGPDGNALTRTGSLIGSPLFMSPEQARGLKTIDHRTDIWSLGAVLYEALTGQPPHHAIESMGDLLITICSKPASPIQDIAPWVPPEVAAIVHRALAIEADERFSSAAEMLDAIRPLLTSGTTLNEWTFAPLSEAARSSRAPRMPVSSSDAPQTMDLAIAEQVPSRATRGSRSSTVQIAIGVVILAAGALGVWKVLPSRRTETPAAMSGSLQGVRLGSAPPNVTGQAGEGQTSGAAVPEVVPVTPETLHAVAPPVAPKRDLARARQEKAGPPTVRPDPDNPATHRLIRRSLE